MKIVQINNCHYRRGGADAAYLNTSELLRSRGHQVLQFSKKSPENIASEQDVYFINNVDYFDVRLLKRILVTPRFIYCKEAACNLRRLVQKEKPDIAHLHLIKGDLTCSILPVLRRAGIPVVMTLHDYGVLCPRNLLLDSDGEICERCLGHTAWECLFTRCNRKSLAMSVVSTAEFIFNRYAFPPERCCDRIIAVSRFAYEKHRRSAKLGDKLVHLYNFYPALEQAWAVTEKGDYFLYFGRLSREKGLKTLLGAWERVPHQPRLKIVGTGPLREELEQYARERRIERVDFLGYQSGEILSALIRNASFIVVPSEYYENNPLSVIEAYAWGKPVIAADIGGLPELVGHGETGFLFTMRDANQLAETIGCADAMASEEYRQMSVRSRAFAEKNFSEDHHYARLTEIYQGAMNANWI